MLGRVKINDDIWIETESDTESELFKSLGRITEVFKHEKCGKCGNRRTHFVCRKDSDDNDWLEIVCQDIQCRAKIIFGQAKKGGVVYPKNRWEKLSETQQEERKDEKEYADAHNGFLPNDGWYVYKRKS